MSENTVALLISLVRDLSDKMVVISQAQERTQADISEVKEQMKQTNSEVVTLVKDKVRRDERDTIMKELKETAPTQQIKDSVVVNKAPTDWEKVRNMITTVIVIVSIAAGSVAVIVEQITSRGKAPASVKEVIK